MGLKSLSKKLAVVCIFSLMCSSTVSGATPNSSNLTVKKQPYNLLGKKMSLDSIVHDGRTYTELREVGKNLGLEVFYQDGIVVLKEDPLYKALNTVLQIEVKSSKAVSATENNMMSTADIPSPSDIWHEIGYANHYDADVILKNGKTYVPMRFVADVFSYDIEYKDGTVIVKEKVWEN